MFLALDGIQRKKHEINPFLADHDKKILLKDNY
jgi:hypothetical protein